MKFLSRLRALLAALSTRTFEATLPNGGRVTVWTREQVVLPVIQGGAPEGDGDGSGDQGGAGDGEAEGASGGGEGDGSGDGGGDGGKGKGSEEPDWKSESRKHERRSKKEREAREAAEAKLKKREEADKSEQEKAVDKAREEGKAEALTVAEKERRKDRLESAVTRAAGKKITIGSGDDAKELRFDDPEDAELYLQRRIERGDLDEDDLFDSDGKVKADVVSETLKQILEEKPRLAEDSGSQTPTGGGDGGKGKGSEGAVSMNDLLRRK